MDWLNDKKNQPIIIGVLSLFILGAVVAIIVTNSSSSGAGGIDTDTSSYSTPPPTDNMPVDGTQTNTAPQPPADTAPQPTDMGSQPAQSQGSESVSSTPSGSSMAMAPMEPWRKDPFLPLNYKPPKKNKKKLKPPITDLPLGAIFPLKPKKIDEMQLVEAVQPTRRMAGVMLDDRVSAIIETNGKYERVWPGKMLDDGLAVVDKIERDRVVLRTTDKKPRTLVVRMAASIQSGS